MPKMVESYPSDSLSFFMFVSREKYLGTLSAMSTRTVLNSICVIPKDVFLATLLVFCEKESNVLQSPP